MQQHLDTEKTEWEERSLLCPISLRRIAEPVVLPRCEEVFDKLSVEEKIKGNVMKCTMVNISINSVCFWCFLNWLTFNKTLHESIKWRYDPVNLQQVCQPDTINIFLYQKKAFCNSNLNFICYLFIIDLSPICLFVYCAYCYLFVYLFVCLFVIFLLRLSAFKVKS